MQLILFIFGLVGFFAMGFPIYIGMVGSSMIYINWIIKMDLITVPHRMLQGINSFPLLAVPFFLLVGQLMGATRLTERLVDLANVLVGHLRGGLAHVNILANIFMAGVSGVATADAATIGGIMIPSMIKQGYSPGFAAAVTASASTIGPIIPPSVVMVVFGAMANVSIARLFLGGIIPGILVGGFLMVASSIICRRQETVPLTPPVKFSLKMRAIKNAAGPLLIPVVIVGGIISGIFTPTEAGVVAAVCIVILGLFVYRSLSWKDFVTATRETLYVLGAIMMAVSSASVYGLVIAQEKAADGLAALLMGISGSPIVIFS